VVTVTGGTGNCDVYLKRGATPTTSDYDFVLSQPDSNESISIANPEPGTWHILVRGTAAYADATLKAEIWP
jgi:hypothetical protein